MSGRGWGPAGLADQLVAPAPHDPTSDTVAQCPTCRSLLGRTGACAEGKTEEYRQAIKAATNQLRKSIYARTKEEQAEPIAEERRVVLQETARDAAELISELADLLAYIDDGITPCGYSVDAPLVAMLRDFGALQALSRMERVAKGGRHG